MTKLTIDDNNGTCLILNRDDKKIAYYLSEKEEEQISNNLSFYVQIQLENISRNICHDPHIVSIRVKEENYQKLYLSRQLFCKFYSCSIKENECFDICFLVTKEFITDFHMGNKTTIEFGCSASINGAWKTSEDIFGFTQFISNYIVKLEGNYVS